MSSPWYREPENLKILACPETHSPLAYAERNGAPVLVCTDLKVPRCYPIIDDIPELLIESAIPLSEEEHRQLIAGAIF